MNIRNIGGEGRIPTALRDNCDAIAALTDAFCRRLSPEYAELCRRMAAALCRKRPSP
jgi:hypothetical protein